jgi:hypothetical protein
VHKAIEAATRVPCIEGREHQVRKTSNLLRRNVVQQGFLGGVMAEKSDVTDLRVGHDLTDRDLLQRLALEQVQQRIAQRLAGSRGPRIARPCVMGLIRPARHLG